MDDKELSFGEALDLLRSKKRVARRNWNGKGQFLELQTPDDHSKMTRPYIYINLADGGQVPWSATSTDLLSYDWYEVKDNE